MLHKSIFLTLCCVLFFLQCCTFSNASEKKFQPVANSKAIVTVNYARFTILTERIIRMEYSQNQQWQDNATWAIPYRYFEDADVPAYTVKSNETHTIISTKYVTVEYLTNSNTTFMTGNIRVTINYEGPNGQMQSVEWNAINHESDAGNLLGTARTLDGTDGQKDLNLNCNANGDPSQHCTYGVISRNGYALIDDTHAPFYDTNPTWPWLVNITYPTPAGSICSLDDNLKRDCGMSGITQSQCEARGCCWSTSMDENSVKFGIPSCFYSTEATQDLYILGHGFDYKTAIREYTMIGGDIPLPPRYMFGVFFSRYWAYASYEERDIIAQYADHSVPLDVLVTDMDWHITFYKQANAGKRDQAGLPIGWTGFTFDDHLFVDHQDFLKWCKQYGLKNTLNLHPASGIQPWEATYPEMAKYMGIDPASNIYVPYNATDLKYNEGWMDIVLHPFEEEGIDLWWLDWQQGEDWINQPYVNPTFWLNYVFYTNPTHWADQEQRPVLLHRWGGLGNHRYQVGFSGDVHPSWSSLEFQPYFTATAANVGYTFWSHDLGGHTAASPPELYTRWLQWGAFSPIFRTHCTKDVSNDRRIWTYPWSYYPTLRTFSKLRQLLTPYIYTQARRVFDTSLALVQPLYYDHPYNNLSYSFPNEYYYGSEFLVQPITAPVDNVTMLAPSTMWFPPGTWINFFTGQVVKGSDDYVSETYYTLSEMPAFVRSGSIVPMLPSTAPPLGQTQLLPETLALITHIGDASEGFGTLYEDSGNSQDYISAGTHAFYNFSYTVGGDNNSTVKFTISAASDNFPGQLTSRAYEIHLRGVFPATSVSVAGSSIAYERFVGDLSVSLAGKKPPTTNGYTYDGASLSVIIYVREEQSLASDFTITVELADSVFSPALAKVNGFAGTLQRFIEAKALLDDQWGIQTVYQDDYPNLLNAASIGERLRARPTEAQQALANDWPTYLASACQELPNISGLNKTLLAQLNAQLCSSFGWASSYPTVMTE
jgi:alpha-glucosidase (family GH31 glycosyl hydrolase)